MSLREGYSIRPLASGDLEKLQQITIDSFEGVSIDRNMELALGGFGQGNWADRKAAAIAEDCGAQPDGVFVATCDAEQGRVVGYITTRLNRVSKVGWIPNLAIEPAHQAHGLGHALIAHALEFFREQGMEIAKIETLEQNSIGQKLYPRLGFQPVARQIHFAMRLEPPQE
jgi:ribosomal protein S18 acetylase RimI-like enzyme